MSSRTDLILQPVDQKDSAAPVASFTHLPGTVVRGSVIPSTQVVAAVASTTPKVDPAFGGALLLVQPNQETKQLADRVYRGTRPVVLADGRVFVQRGEEGEPPTDEQLAQGQLRVDHLSIDEIDTGTGVTRTVAKFEGYIAFLVGALEPELIVYLVRPSGASLQAIDIASGRTRAIAPSIPPFARDLSIDAQARAVLLTNLDPSVPGKWQVVSVPIGQAAQAPAPVNVIARNLRRSTVATAWPGHSFALSDETDRLIVRRAARSTPIMSLGPGVIHVQEFYKVRQRTFAVGLHRALGKSPTLFVVDENGSQVTKLAAPERSHLDVAGVVSTDATSNVQPAGIRRQLPTRLRSLRINPSLFPTYKAVDVHDQEDPR